MTFCEYCKRMISEKNLSRHYISCKDKINLLHKEELKTVKEQFDKYQRETTKTIQKYEKETQSLQLQLNNLQETYKQVQLEKERLQDQLFEIAKQPKNNTNNNQRTMNIVNQLAPYDLDAESVRALIEEHFDKKCFMQGAEGITKMVANQLLTDQETGKKKMLCTDLARRKVKYIIDGKVVHDVGMQRTLDLICPNLAQVNMRHSKREGPPSDDIYLANNAFIRDKSKLCSKIVIHFIPESETGPVNEVEQTLDLE